MADNRRLAQLRACYNILYRDLDRWTLDQCTIRRHSREVLALRAHPTGEFVASAGHDYDWLDYDDKNWGRALYFWNTDNRPILGHLVTSHRSTITDFQFSTNDTNVFVASSDSSLSQWSFSTAANIQFFNGHTKRVNSVHRSPDSRLICSGSDDGETRIWDVRTSQPIRVFANSGRNPVNAVTFDYSGTRVISAEDQKIDIWDIRASSCVSQLNDHAGKVTGTSLSPEGSHLLSNSQDDTMRLWDVRPASPVNGRCVNVYYGHQHDRNSQHQLLRCAWSPDSYWVSAGSSDGFLCVWSSQWSTPRAIIKAHDRAITDVAFHPVRDEVMWGSVDSKVFWQDLRTRRW